MARCKILTWPLTLLAASALLTRAVIAEPDSTDGIIDGLLDNGNFEIPPSGNATTAKSTASIVTSLPGWQIQGTVEYIKEGQTQGNMLLVVPEGQHAVRLGNDAVITQAVRLEKDSTYSLTFSAARTCAQLETLNVSVPPVSGTIDLQTLYNIHGWDAYAWAFKATTDADSDILFHNPGMEEDPACGPVIDSIAIKKLFVPDTVDGNRVVNGDFEEGPWMFKNGSLALGVLLPTNPDVTTSALPGWTVESSRAVRYVDSDHYKVPQGKRAVELLSGKEGIISQMVSTVPGKKYTMSFVLDDAETKCGGPKGVMAFAGDESLPFHLPTTAEPNNVSFTAKAERTRIALYSIYYNTREDDHSSLCGPVIDDVRVYDPTASGASPSAVAVSGCAGALFSMAALLLALF
eukprot:TRINITY_DN15824_c0_g1_i1.p1 TRINITY_DN15824_c0_g1~~TRINITY_DN15824_c0_g1_i1.p1  ORF type:complete len:414 (-),score=-12.43 TRINITY_DN15824_c0_g1_i1:216-1430(-)